MVKNQQAIIHKSKKQLLRERKETVLLTITDIISCGKKLLHEKNLKLNFFDKEMLTKTNNICYENDRKDFAVIKKTEIKVIKSFSRILVKFKFKSQEIKLNMNILKKS